MSPKNIMILNIDAQIKAEYIANVFWTREIAKVSTITLIPKIEKGVISNICYIDIDSYCETEAAYEFIRCMDADFFVFCHDESDPDNNMWLLEKNTHNSGNLFVGPYTTAFMPEFFTHEVAEADPELNGTLLTFAQSLLPPHDSVVHANENIENDDGLVCDTEEWEDFIAKRPIKGLGNDYYSVDEALEHLWVINEHLDNEPRFSERIKLEEELEHFENELQKYESFPYPKGITMGELLPELFMPVDVKREIAGQWIQEYDSLFNNEFPMAADELMPELPPPPQMQREVAMSVEEFIAQIPPPQMQREVAMSVDEYNRLTA
jgi:hypothetical protein